MVQYFVVNGVVYSRRAEALDVKSAEAEKTRR